MSEQTDALSYWGVSEELADFFKPSIEESDYTAKAISVMQNQYDKVSHDDVVLFQKLLGNLADFDELMRLNNSHLLDNQMYQQNAYQVFNLVAEAINNINTMRDHYTTQSAEYSTYSSALIYSQELINHHMKQLMHYEPHSLALKWFNGWSALHI